MKRFSANVDKTYTHFAVNEDNKIVTGWDYSNCDAEERKHYSKIDLKDWFPDTYKTLRVLSIKSLNKLDINPFDWNFWLKQN